jgi:ABC-type transport system involved in cytochrome bd biosynthesis fused ATPase/permease subunit
MPSSDAEHVVRHLKQSASYSLIVISPHNGKRSGEIDKIKVMDHGRQLHNANIAFLSHSNENSFHFLENKNPNPLLPFLTAFLRT